MKPLDYARSNPPDPRRTRFVVGMVLAAIVLLASLLIEGPLW